MRTQPQASPRPTPPDPVMYFAAWPVVAAAVMCAGGSIESVPGLLNFLLAVVSVGIATSYWLRRIGADRRRVNLTVTGTALVLGVAAMVVDQEAVLETVSVKWLMQSGIDGLVVTFLIRGIAWITAFRCFTLLTDLELVLSLGFSISLFMLTSVITDDAPLLAYFAPFAIGGLDLLLRYHNRTLQQQVDRVVGRRARPWRQEAGSVVSLTAGVALGTVLLTVLAGNLDEAGWSEVGGSGFTDRITAWFEKWQGTGQETVLTKQMDVGGRASSSSLDAVFRAKTSDPQLWRGIVYDCYNGRIWQPVREQPISVERRGPGRFYVGGPIDDLRRGDIVRHRVTYAEPCSLIYNARHLVAVEVRPFRVAFSSAGRGTTWPAMPRGTVCLLYCLAEDAPDRLKLPLNQLSDEQRQRYLQLPDGLPGRVSALAREVTAGKDDDYERMVALNDYLGTQKLYTEDPGSIPTEADAVDWFLHEMTSGWCRHFASAAAILGRCVGIPTRLVDGYTPGSLDGSGDSFLVRQRDAHVWCEAWFADRGWVSFDPTVLAAEEPPPMSQGLIQLQAQLDWAMRAIQDRLGGSRTWLALIALATLALVGWEGHRRGWLAVLAGVRAGSGGPALRLERRLHRLLRRVQLSRQTHEPELLFAARAGHRLPRARAELREFSELLCEGRYSGRTLNAAQLQLAEQLLDQIAVVIAQRGGLPGEQANGVAGGVVDGSGRAPSHRPADLAADPGDRGRSAGAAVGDGPPNAPR